MAGKRVKCKYCGVVFLIAADARSADEGQDLSALDELNALHETGKHAAKRGPAGAGAGGEDIDSLFHCEYPSEGAPRTNKLYIFPMSRLLDHWLPQVLLTSGLLIGLLIGAIVALPLLFLLFRLMPHEAPVTFAYGTGSFLLSVAVVIAAAFALNLMLVGTLRATKTEQALRVSPFGPEFQWDGPLEKVKKKLA